MIKKGSNRWVIYIGGFAFKIPSLYNYKRFLRGLLSNMQEIEFSHVVEFKEKLCPILYHLPFGFLIVMPRVRVLNEGEISKEELNKFCRVKEGNIPAELKSDSFGYYKGRLVAIDYGD